MKNFREKLKEADIPKGLSVSEKSIWHLKKGDWDKAHDLLQEEDSREALAKKCTAETFNGTFFTNA